MTSHTLKIKELYDALRLIKVLIDNHEMVKICLDGLALRFDMIKSAILARENPASFSAFSWYEWLKKIMFDQGAMCSMVKCSTPNQTREEDSSEKTEADSDEADIFSLPENITPIIGKRPETH